MTTKKQSTATTQTTEILLPGLVEPSGLQIRHRTLPAPGAGQALVQVEASGISFAEQGMRRGRYPGQPAFPFVPGYDLVGTVRAVGPGVREEWIGTRVCAVTKIGGWATYVLIAADTLVPVPPGLDPALVETVLVNGVTAWQMLYRKARVKAGQTILVHGANGGVGTVLCQIALHSGIRVIGTAAPRHHDALRAIGVERSRCQLPTGEVYAFTWVPDGKAILYVRNEHGVGNIWSAPLDGKAPRKLTAFDSEIIFAFDVSPDNRLVISRGSVVRDVVLIKNAR